MKSLISFIVIAAFAIFQAANTTPSLPPGVTLQAIDGETLTSSTTMSNNYYTRSGHSAAATMGWDSPSFFSLGTFLCDYSAGTVPTAITQMNALGWNTIQVWNTIDNTAVTANNISVVGSFQSSKVTANNIVGLNTFDEPSTYAQGVSTPIGTQSNAVQDPLFWQINLTINWAIGNLPSGIPAPSTAAHMMSVQVATPNTTTRSLDLQSIDQYWFAASRDPGAFQFATINGKSYYGLGSNMTADQMSRGSNYGDIIDKLRSYQSGGTPAPLGVYLETGEPYWNQAGFATNAATSTSSAVLSFASLPPVLAAGYTCTDITTGQVIGTILSTSTNTITLNANAAFAVSSGDHIAFTANSMAITPPELNWAMWSEIIHGARMLYIFDHFGPTAGTGTTADNLLDTRNTFYTNIQSGQSVSMQTQAQATGALVKLMAPIINSPFGISYGSASPAGYTFPTATLSLATGIDIMSKWYQGSPISNTIGGGPSTFTPGFYIFADTRASETQTNISATFTVNDPNATSVVVVGESRTIAISGGTFTDTFANAWTVHIYQVIG